MYLQDCIDIVFTIYSVLEKYFHELAALVEEGGRERIGDEKPLYSVWMIYCLVNGAIIAVWRIKWVC